MRKPIPLTVALLATCFALKALADITVTQLTAPSTVTALHFYVPGDGGVMPAQVCGRTLFSDGGPTPVECFDVPNGGLAAGNGINTSVQGLSTGAGLTLWKGQKGL